MSRVPQLKTGVYDRSMEELSGTALARALAARRRRKIVACAVCGKEMIAVGPRRYCGYACAKRAYRVRARQRQQQQTEKMPDPERGTK
jgi:hypothetical protein